jgi:hypothetical protein
MRTTVRQQLFAVSIIAAMLLAACGGGSPQNEEQRAPPVVTFDAPADGSYVNGTITVQATATGAATISELKFNAPPALVGVMPTLDANARSGTLTAALNLAPFPDGPLTISVTATDSLGGSTTRELTVRVAQTAPTINIGSPSPSSTSTVRGHAHASTMGAPGHAPSSG